jgi:hypothetical protein
LPFAAKVVKVDKHPSDPKAKITNQTATQTTQTTTQTTQTTTQTTQIKNYALN